jgi:hypothetical protein
MKQIPLKKVAMILPTGKESSLDYRLQLIAIMQAPKDPKRGAEIEEIHKSLRVINVLDKAEGAEFVELEDADFDYMLSKLSTVRFNFVSPAFSQFVEDMQGERNTS